MKKLAVLVLLGVLFAGVSQARTWYVSPTGSDTTCTSVNKGPLSKPNADAHTGDVIILSPGTYATGIAPSRSGVDTTSSRITYVGDLSDSSTTIVTTFTLTKRAITIKGITANAGFNGDWTSASDSLYKCEAKGSSHFVMQSADSNYVVNCLIAVKQFRFMNTSDTYTDSTGAGWVHNNSIINTTFNITHTEDNTHPAIKFSGVTHAYLSNVTFNATATSSSTCGLLKLYCCRRSNFETVIFNLTEQSLIRSGANEPQLGYFRDGTQFNYFHNCKFLFGGLGYDMYFTGSGIVGSGNLNVYNTYDGCELRYEGTGPSAGAETDFTYQSTVIGDTWHNCVFVSSTNRPLFGLQHITSNFHFYNNTLVHLAGKTAFREITANEGTIRDNIFVSVNGCPVETWDSSSIYNGMDLIDYNVLYGGPTCSNSNCLVLSGVATGVGNPGQDYHSRYVNPLLVGGGNVMSYDCHLQPNSPAIGMGTGGGTVGAYGYTVVTGPSVRYIGLGGSDNSTGLDYANRWATVGKANLTCIPGDIVYVYEGDYVDPINPVHAAESSNSLIRFIGASLNGDPIAYNSYAPRVGATGLPSLISLNGIKIVGNLTINGDRDSVENCTIQGELILNGSDYSDIGDCTVSGPRIRFGSTTNRSKTTKLRWITALSLGNAITTSPNVLDYKQLDSCQVSFCNFGVKEEAGATTSIPQDWDHITNSRFYSNKTIITNNNTTIGYLSCYALRMRDSTFLNTVLRDTIVVLGNGGCSIYPNMTVNSAIASSAGSTVIDSCYWNLSNAPSIIYVKDRLKVLTIKNSTLVAKNNPALLIGGLPSGKSFIDHNTFVSDGEWGVVDIGDHTKGTWTTWADSSLKFTNNILYLDKNPLISDPIPYLPTDPGTKNWPLTICRAVMGTSSFTSQAKFVADYNMFSYYGYANTRADRSVILTDNGYVGYLSGAPRAFKTSYNFGTHDQYGSPRFIDSTLTANFTSNLCSYSAAQDSGAAGTDIGAFQLVGSPVVSFFPQVVNFHLGIVDTAYISIFNLDTGTGDIEADPSCVTGTPLCYPSGVTIIEGHETQVSPSTTPYTWTLAYDGSGPLRSGYFYSPIGYPFTVNHLPPCGSPSEFRIPINIIP